MRAIILSAGQGRRLFPFTETMPKCLLTLREEVSVLEFQLRTLATCGVQSATVVVGFGADDVERHIEDHTPAGLDVETLYNPFFESTDNLVTAWLTRERMSGDFLLLNGDTIFEPALLQRVLDAPSSAATITVDRKPRYDEDDMKVSLTRGGTVLAVSKTLKAKEVDAEAIGLIRFSPRGGAQMARGLERAVRDRESHGRYYLSVVSENAASSREIESVSIEGLWWQEIDCPPDLLRARSEFTDRWEGWLSGGLARLARDPD